MNKPAETQLHNEIDKASETQEISKFPGMTYEQGVIDALEWALGVSVESPMED